MNWLVTLSMEEFTDGECVCRITVQYVYSVGSPVEFTSTSSCVMNVGYQSCIASVVSLRYFTIGVVL